MSDLPDSWRPTASCVTFPPFAVVCGMGSGARIDIVPCEADGADCSGWAERSAPHGPTKDCVGRWDAYAHGRRFWICWYDFLGDVRHRAMGAFAQPVVDTRSMKEERSMNIGEPKHVREIEPVDVPVPSEVPVEVPVEEPVGEPVREKELAALSGEQCGWIPPRVL